ncbi:hypothetical protein [Paramaledivibacter caminithermalis]|jgi:hypothetical protein|uniref:Uncharacterized protein n=1 Tax=Paramaledivibacter caminithermalis (strain DSM 15212 / CIP 107654 / DViRD3) TaxID=1121301 RepID=A0A1M6QGV7_PARC5|nr:hypothetical protein [Paramaledivibacter caminithermalis]SHK19405.1 hypothetical protein SAMN02745912_02573 [Paramaledivibacter caminithermalis DSM 15212]
MIRTEKRKLIRTKTFKDLLKVIKSCFKDLLPKLNNVKDNRYTLYITYETGELLYRMLIAKILTVDMMRDVTSKFNIKECIENFTKILENENLKKLPHHYTINAFFNTRNK